MRNQVSVCFGPPYIKYSIEYSSSKKLDSHRATHWLTLKCDDCAKRHCHLESSDTLYARSRHTVRVMYAVLVLTSRAMTFIVITAYK